MSQQQALELPYGQVSPGSLRIPSDAQVETSCGLPPVENIRQAVQDALATPFDFPSIEQAIVPGDRVALAVAPSVPQMPSVVRAVIEYLVAQGTSAQQCTVVLTGYEASEIARLKAELERDDLSAVTLESHDADDSGKVAYVAANKQGDPIYMNRSLVDSDVVIPILCARARRAIDYQGAYGVFPLLSDRKTRGQFYSLKHLTDPTEHSRLQAWADEAAWWVGVLVAIQVVPASDGQVGAILAGSLEPLENAVQSTLAQAWTTHVEGTYDAVVTMIDGDQAQQTWDSIARAVAMASPFLAPEGVLVLCSELEVAPGRALRKLSDPDRSEEKLGKELSSDNSDDALAAALLLQSLEYSHIYLLSKLPREAVESIGLGALESLSEAEHVLVDRGRTLVLGSAQHRNLS